MLNYTPPDWYWLADDGRIFSSSRGDKVGTKDAGWVAAKKSGQWTVWPADEAGQQTEAAIQDVLAPFGIFLGLDSLKTALTTLVDAEAEEQRLKHITGGSGQAMTYAQKATEAQRCLSEDEPRADDFPLLLAEVGVTGDTVGEVAMVVKAANVRWQQIGAAIEAVRLSTKENIAAAGSAQDAKAIFDAVSWPDL